MEEVDRCTRDLQCRFLVERFYRRNFTFGHSKLVLSVYILKEPLIDDLRTSHPDERVELRVMPALFERIIQWLEAHRRYYMVAVKSSSACSVKIRLCTIFTINTCRLKVEMLTTRPLRLSKSISKNSYNSSKYTLLLMVALRLTMNGSAASPTAIQNTGRFH